MGFTWNPATLTATTKRKAIERFWKFVYKTDGCWLWTGPQTRDGYGRLRPGHGTNYVTAHRFSYELHYGPIPPGLKVLHKCDVSLCVKPTDFFLGDNRANIDDMVSKGRQRKGEEIEHAKLTVEQVRQIKLRPLSFSNAYLGKEFGVAKESIRRIRIGATWKHVTPLEPPKEG